ncbi:ImmA/IrrE family metallo-endopeptidase [Micromonospora fluostatini]|uniref:ImmA/IrrE family metallo-endopeptidase n=1 Tax=Micromonospora sp. JCM 30529 TaxID=3421643 RepID=UPI003D16C1F0
MRRLNLAPPVQIEDIAGELAEISEEPWPFEECDAVIVGLLEDNPKIFLRRSLPRRRRRFTLAHEFGHLCMAWHIGVFGCRPEQSQYSEQPLEPASEPEQITSWWRREEQEAEATRFASHLLMPDSFLRPLIKSMDMAQVLHGLNIADVSASAALMRLRRMLQPGFCFAIEEYGNVRLFTSPGTSLGEVEAGSEFRGLEAKAYEHGGETVGGRQVNWYRLTDFTSSGVVVDPRSTTALARSAIAAFESDPMEQDSLYRSINGVVGGSLSKERAETVAQALALLRHKFSGHPRFGRIATHPDLDLYLRRKAEEWGQKRGL